METSQKTKTRTVIFKDKDSADAAYNAALKRGYKPNEISVLMSDDTRKKYYGTDTVVKTEKGDQSLEGLAMGSAIGGTVLGTIGAILALSSTIVIPGLGLVIAGPLAAGLVGFGAGSITGGVLGLLIGAGVPEERAKIYEKQLKDGGILVTVNSHDKDDDLLIEDWKKYKGTDIY